DGDVEIALELSNRSTVTATVRLQRPTVDHCALELLEPLRTASGLGFLDARLVDLLQRGEAGWPQTPIRYAIDLAGRSNSGIVVEGWIENARSQGLSFLSHDGLTFISGADAIYKARGDVSDHLRKLQSPVLTDDHGVLLNFPVCAADTDSFLILRDEQEALA